MCRYYLHTWECHKGHNTKRLHACPKGTNPTKDQPTGLSCGNQECVTTFSKPLMDEHPHCLSPICCKAFLDDLKEKVWLKRMALVFSKQDERQDSEVDADKKRIEEAEEALENGKAYHEVCAREQALQPEWQTDLYPLELTTTVDPDCPVVRSSWVPPD